MSNEDLKALVKAQETAASVDDLVDEYVRLTVIGGGDPHPDASALHSAKEGIGKLFRSQLESGDTEIVMRALNALAELRRQKRERDKLQTHGGERDVVHPVGSAGAMSAATVDGGAEGSHEVSPDKPTRADHGRSAIDQDPQRKKAADGAEPEQSMAPDKRDHKRHR